MVRRVVITGKGAISPLGVGIQTNWDRLIQGESGIGSITRFSTENFASQVAGQIPEKSKKNGFNPSQYFTQAERRKYDKFTEYGLVAVEEAMQDAGLKIKTESEAVRAGTYIGSGIGGLSTIEQTSQNMVHNLRSVSPFFITASLINSLNGHVSIKYNLKGPSIAVATACTTSLHAVGEATRIIQSDDADIMIAGGAEASITTLGIQAFSAMRALSTHFNDRPKEASRPWSKDRDGFVMSEGAAILVLEELEHAKKRGATIYGEIVGYGLSADAYHIAAPPPNANGAIRSIEMALKKAHIHPEKIGYVNAHATSTPIGDRVELIALKKVFNTSSTSPAISSTKSATGHLLGATGALEIAFTLQSILSGITPPTLNLHDSDEESHGLNLVPLTAQTHHIEYALSNSFGFGGTNGTIILKKFTG